jgi:hypothetical protein
VKPKDFWTFFLNIENQLFVQGGRNSKWSLFARDQTINATLHDAFVFQHVHVKAQEMFNNPPTEYKNISRDVEESYKASKSVQVLAAEERRKAAQKARQQAPGNGANGVTKNGGNGM